ncbi:hypothetical protein DL95DRAFT_157736 [Leptodontidium sp. 2 PMI_412]|nr:hypothetical protein DL95DRAFT_157736 [Leptodontidium sp. 2 PMI_412]
MREVNSSPNSLLPSFTHPYIHFHPHHQASFVTAWIHRMDGMDRKDGTDKRLAATQSTHATRTYTRTACYQTSFHRIFALLSDRNLYRLDAVEVLYLSIASRSPLLFSYLSI